MSIGNLKDQGNQSKNFPWQLKMLLGQQCACDQLTAINANTDNVEPLLVQILTAIQAGTDYEAALVVDSADVTWLEIRIWNGTTFDPPVYYLAGSNTSGTPAFPITYINPNTYLAQIVSNTTGLATEITAANIFGASAQTAIQTQPQLRNPGILRTSGPGGLPVTPVYDFSVSNVGSANGIVLGALIKPGETFNFSAGGIQNTFTPVTYDGTGTELVFIYSY